jgi:hypothetical protein|tara:strand:- start:379 stop:552 length:174 start_codon:yes stop_codon:yes gene_type:complete
MTKAPPKPDPATISSSLGDEAKKQQEIAARAKRNNNRGFYSRSTAAKPMGGENQTLG